MAEHRWSILCRRGVVDKYTNLLSIFEVLDEGNSDDPPAEASAGDVSISINAQMVSMWARSRREKPEKFWQAVTITGPDGETKDTGVRIEGNLESHPRTRLLIGVQAIPFSGFGTYVFNIHYTQNKQDLGERVGAVPIDIKPSTPANQSSDKTSTD